MTASSPPFERSCALDQSQLLLVDVNDQTSGSDNTGAPPISHLPGHPAVGLGAEEVKEHFDSSFATPVLDELKDHLYLVALPDKTRIDPLNRQRAQGRAIVATDDPRLHLTYGSGNFYVQAVPAFLLNYDFWVQYLQDEESSAQRATALGYLRSYSRLVASPLDFTLAKEAHLFPDDKTFDWPAWAAFIKYFKTIDDKKIAPRYHHGQLSLFRLDWAARLVGPKSAQRAGTPWIGPLAVHYTAYDGGSLTNLILAACAVASTLLLAMLVALTVPTDRLWSSWTCGSTTSRLTTMSRLFWILSVLLVVVTVLLVVVPLSVFLWEVQTAQNERENQLRRERAEKRRAQRETRKGEEANVPNTSTEIEGKPDQEK